MEKTSFKLAVAQPEASSEVEEPKVETAAVMVAEAGRNGTDLIVFPEGYPGPLRHDSDYDAAPRLSEAARDASCSVAWGRIELGADGFYRTVHYIYGDDGEEILRYERAHPATGDVHPVLNGVPMFPGPVLGMAEVAGVKIGITICSELWVTEAPRTLALMGAEIILAPAGGGFHQVAENWRLLARARAIENECYVALTQQLFPGERGSALIAGPEHLVSSSEDVGVQYGDLDLERARWLREIDDSMQKPKPFDSLPGVVRARRPELYGALTDGSADLYDYETAGRAVDRDAATGARAATPGDGAAGTG